MVDRQLQAAAFSLPDAQKRELIAVGLSRLGSFSTSFATNVVYDPKFLRSMEQEYKIFFVTVKGTTTRYGIFVKSGEPATNTYCRAVITSRDGKELPVSKWGKVMLRRDDDGKMMVLCGW